MKDSDFGSSADDAIKKNWIIKKMSDICDLQNGYAFQSKTYVDRSNTLNIRMSNIRPSGEFDPEHNIRYLPDNFVTTYSQYLLSEGDLVIAMTDMADVPKLIAQFRQSVLATAFRGDLTADWREKNPDVESASELLERIKIDRRKRWESIELDKMRAQGKEPKDDKWKDRYKEYKEISYDILSNIPDTWLAFFECRIHCSTIKEVSKIQY